MLCDRAAGRQLIHALTEPADIVKRVELAMALAQLTMGLGAPFSGGLIDKFPNCGSVLVA
jgi:hypothetical protein